MTLFMAYTGLFTIEEHVVSMWVHEKGWSGQKYDETRPYFTLCFNKGAQTEANLCKLEKNAF
jgi:hypothetical protein